MFTYFQDFNMLRASKRLSDLIVTAAQSAVQCHMTGWQVGTRTLGTSVPRMDYKAELTAKQMSNDNPFDTYVIKPEAGRGLYQGAPILIPSTKDSR